MSEHSLPSSAPEEQGISSLAVLRFVEAIEKKHLELHSFILLRHGYEIARGWWEPYKAEDPHMLFSLSKSFTSSAVGLAVSEGLLTVDDPVISFFPEDLPQEISQNLAEMKVKHLLTMSTGHAEDTTGQLRGDRDSDNWVRIFLSLEVQNKPGKPFVYNSGATYMLSAIIQKVTGMTLLEYLMPRLFEPLGITNPTWESCPRGINTGGWGLSIRTEDIARFGQMYLQKGAWNGQQILPAEWVEESTSKKVSNETNTALDWKQGYGYQFWRCQYGAYRGDGAFGQYCIVMPDQDAVLAITSGVGDMQAVLNLVWKHLLGNMRQIALRRNPRALERLQKKLASLQLPGVVGHKESPLTKAVSGATYVVKKNNAGVELVRFDFNPDGCLFTLRDHSGEQRVHVGSELPMKDVTGLFLPGIMQTPVTSVAAWKDENTFIMRLRFTQTPFNWIINCQFRGDSVILRAVTNVSFGPTKMPRLIGMMIK